MTTASVRVLLVEDDEDHAVLIRSAFEEQGNRWKVTVARTLAEARRCLEASPPDLVILDLVLPDGRGTQLIPNDSSLIRFPFVLMTSHGNEAVAVEAIKRGALDYVVKSEFSLSDMPRIAERALREWELISARERSREREKQLLSQLAHASRVNAMGEMATVLAHELNQPLAAIAAYSGICVDLLNKDQVSRDFLHSPLTEIDRQAHRAGQIINRVKQFVRHAAPNVSAVDLNDLIQEVCGLMKHAAHEHRIKIDFQLDEALPPVLVDGLQIQQVLVNLLQNSLEAIEREDLDRRRVTLTTARHQDFVEVRVRDRGRGLTPEQLGRLFEPYFTTKPDGLGLGLSISQRIVEAHGGRLEAVPETGGGMLMRFTLPIAGQCGVTPQES